MKQVQKYITRNLSSLFISMFLPLFFTASVIFLIKLATYTAIIELTPLDMLKLYIFVLPELLFYTLPISFFVAATLAMLKLSNDNEIVVMFSLGIRPSLMVKTLLKPAILLFFVMALDFLVLFPHTKVISTNFLLHKKSEAKFNLSASEFGNSFGDWLLYLGKENPDGSFGDVFLFNKENNEEILISAKHAEVLNENATLRLRLTDGEGYSYSEESFSQIDFDLMHINDAMNMELKAYETPIEYWSSDLQAKSKKEALITNSLLSFFPIISLFLVLSIGVVHARHQKSYAYLSLFVTILLYYSATLVLQKFLGFALIPLLTLSWLLVTYLIYKKTIVSKF